MKTAYFPTGAHLDFGGLLETRDSGIVSGREGLPPTPPPAKERKAARGRTQEIASRRNVEKAKLTAVIGLGSAHRNQSAFALKGLVATQGYGGLLKGVRSPDPPPGLPLRRLESI